MNIALSQDIKSNDTPRYGLSNVKTQQKTARNGGFLFIQGMKPNTRHFGTVLSLSLVPLHM